MCEGVARGSEINEDLHDGVEISLGTLQSPPKESIHLRQSQVLKTEGATGKVGGTTHPL